MAPTALTDAALVARSRERDTSAFGVLVERHQRLVFGVALARCGDPALAEEVAQEAFVSAWRDIARLRDDERVGPWVAGIARNLAAGAARRRARRDAIEIDAPATVPTPEDAVRQREDRELLQRALADVPHAYREALVLYYFHGESIAQIADVLGVSEDVVKQRLSRGRRGLRDHLTARVESALVRARPRAAFGAGVVVAIAGSTTGEAAAATSAAGKVLTMASSTKLVIAIGTAAIAGTVIYIGTRASASNHDSIASPPAPMVTAQAPATALDASQPRARRLADAKARTTLLQAIRQAHAADTGDADRRVKTYDFAGTPVPSPTAAAPAAPSAPPLLEVNKEYIRHAVRAIIPLLSECYQEGLAREPRLAGTVVVDFTIEAEPGVGAVVGESEIVGDESDLVDATVHECIQHTMYALELDAPEAGGQVRVRYPFAFAPAPPKEP